jgi:hypothetical protein
MRRRTAWPLALALWALPASALADDAVIDAGTDVTYLHVSTSPSGAKTMPVTGLTARWLFVDGGGEIAFGGKLTAFKPVWGGDTDNMGFDLSFTAQFSGRWKGEKAHVMPCGGFGLGLRQLFLDVRNRPAGAYAISGVGLDLYLGVHGYFGRRGGLYWRLAGVLESHLLFPAPGWTAGAGAELTIGIYLD